MLTQHPLARLLAEEAEPLSENEIGSFPGYDPVAQLQINWKDVQHHLEVLCSSSQTGDPNTMSATTSYGPHNEHPDQDADDSGT